jgi:hypothetical protein
MRTACVFSIAVALFLSFSPFSSTGSFYARAQQEKKKEKDETETKVSGELGSKTNPVRCSGPPGER